MTILEERGFPRLYSIVLGLVSGKLENESAEPGVNFNATDSKGRAALSWAVRRQDHTATRLLLYHNAGPNIAAFSGDTSVGYATRWQNVTGLRLLLEAGASIRLKSWARRTLLHYASICVTVCDALEILMAAGCNVHEKNCSDYTPLDFAA